MLCPSWSIFAGRRRETRIKSAFREMFYRSPALAGLIVSAPIALLTALLVN
ncbi:MAG: hypothetical protein ABIP06_14590 [Pyrinomonadaceae bacterium]